MPGDLNKTDLAEGEGKKIEKIQKLKDEFIVIKPNTIYEIDEADSCVFLVPEGSDIKIEKSNNCLILVEDFLAENYMFMNTPYPPETLFSVEDINSVTKPKKGEIKEYIKQYKEEMEKRDLDLEALFANTEAQVNDGQDAFTGETSALLPVEATDIQAGRVTEVDTEAVEAASNAHEQLQDLAIEEGVTTDADKKASTPTEVGDLLEEEVQANIYDEVEKINLDLQTSIAKVLERIDSLENQNDPKILALKKDLINQNKEREKEFKPVAKQIEIIKSNPKNRLLKKATSKINDITIKLREINGKYQGIMEKHQEAFQLLENSTAPEDSIPDNETATDLQQPTNEGKLANPAITYGRSIQGMLDEARLANILINKDIKGDSFEAIKSDLEKQLQFLNVAELKLQFGKHIEGIITGILEGKISIAVKDQLELICKETGLSQAELNEVIASSRTHITNQALGEANIGIGWKGAVTRVAGYAGLGIGATALGGAAVATTVLGATFGPFGIPLAIVGLRTIDKVATTIYDSVKLKAQEKKVRKEIEGDEDRRNLLQDSFAIELAKAQQKRIKGGKFDINEFWEKNPELFASFMLTETVENDITDEEKKKTLSDSFVAIEAIEQYKEKQIRNQKDIVERFQDDFKKTRIGKFIGKIMPDNPFEKTVTATTIGIVGAMARECAPVRMGLMALAGYRAGGAFEEMGARYLGRRKEAKKSDETKEAERVDKASQAQEQISEDEQIASINNSEDALKVLEQIRQSTQEKGKKYVSTRTVTKFTARLAGAGLGAFIGYYLTPNHKVSAGDHKPETPDTGSGKTPDTSSDHPTPPSEESLMEETRKKAMASTAVRGNGPTLTDPHNHDGSHATGSGKTETGSDVTAKHDNPHEATTKGSSATPEAKAPAMTPELKHQLELATIKNGGSVERSLIEQLKDHEIARKFGYDPAKDGKIGHWAGIKAHQIAIDKGYVGEHGQEVRVGTSGIGKAAYILEIDTKGDVSVHEYFDGESKEVHAPNTEFEKVTEQYEYKYGKGGADHVPENTPAPAHEVTPEINHDSGSSATETTASNGEIADTNKLLEPLEKLPAPLSPDEILKLEASSDTPLDGYTLYPTQSLPESNLNALDKDLGGGLKLFEVDTNQDGKTDHIFSFFDGRIINRDALDHEDLNNSLRINEIRLDNQIENTLGRLCEDSISREQLVELIKTGKEAGITGFSPLEGAIPGSSFENFLSYFKGHSNLFTDTEGKLSADQIKIFENYNDQIINRDSLDNILSNTQNLSWGMDQKMALAQAMIAPEPETAQQLLADKDVAFASKVSWTNNHTIKIEGLVNGHGKLIMDLNDPEKGISIPNGLFGLGSKHFAIDQIKDALTFLRAKI